MGRVITILGHIGKEMLSQPKWLIEEKEKKTSQKERDLDYSSGAKVTQKTKIPLQNDT